MSQMDQSLVHPINWNHLDFLNVNCLYPSRIFQVLFVALLSIVMCHNVVTSVRGAVQQPVDHTGQRGAVFDQDI